MLAGLQGAGKTTLAGKLGHWLKQGHTPLLVAQDLQRPGAVSQLQIVGERAGVPVSAPHPGPASAAGCSRRQPGDPVAVARAGIDEAVSQHYDVVVIDTAGRRYRRGADAGRPPTSARPPTRTRSRSSSTR